MLTSVLIWLDRKVFRHHWAWLCNLAWDKQMERDVAQGKLDAESRRRA